MSGFVGTERAVARSAWVNQIPVGWSAKRLKWTIESSINGIWGDEADGGDDDVICYRVAESGPRGRFSD